MEFTTPDGRTIDLREAAEKVLRSLDSLFECLLQDRTQVEEKWRGRIQGAEPAAQARVNENPCLRVGLAPGLDPQRKQGLGLVEIERSDRMRLVGRLVDLSFDGLELELVSGERIRLIPEAVEHVRVV